MSERLAHHTVEYSESRELISQLLCFDQTVLEIKSKIGVINETVTLSELSWIFTVTEERASRETAKSD